jgi:hypothetical protein
MPGPDEPDNERIKWAEDVINQAKDEDDPTA